MAEVPITSEDPIAQTTPTTAGEIPRGVTGLRELTFIALIVVIGISAAAIILNARVKLQNLGNTLQQYQIECEQIARNVNHLLDGMKDDQLNEPVVSFLLSRITGGLKEVDKLTEQLADQIDDLNGPIIRRLATVSPAHLATLGNDADTRKLREFAKLVVKTGSSNIHSVLAKMDQELAIAIHYGDHLDDLRYRVGLASQLSHRGTQPLLILLLTIGASVLFGIWAVWLRALKPGIAALRSSNLALEATSKSLHTQNLAYMRREIESLAAQRIAKFGYWVVNEKGEVEGSEGLAHLLSIPVRRLPKTLLQLARIGRTSSSTGNKSDVDILSEYLDQSDVDCAREFTRIVDGENGRERIIRERVETSLMPGTGSRYMIGIMLDVTELSHAQERAARAEKLDSIGVLTGIIAHDFNNVLAVVKASIDLMERNPENVSARISTMRRAVASAATLINQLNAITREEKEEQELLDPRVVLLETVKLFKSNALNTVTIELDLKQTNDQFIQINRGKFENAILNLLLNAREAIDGRKDGLVRVSCRIEDNPQLDGNEGRRLTGKFMRIEVADNGHGMNAELLRRAVDPFFSTKPHHSALPRGLGLWSVYQFIRGSNGEFSINSTEGQGTTVVMFLQRQTAVTPAVAPIALRQKLPKQRLSAAILIVDDAEDLLAVLAEQLQGLNYSIYSAPNISLALKVLTEQPDISVIISDVNLRHGETGLQLATHIKKTYPEKKVVFISGYPMSSHDDDEHGEIAVVRKPIDIEELDDEIQRLLHSEVPTRDEALS